MSIQNVSTRKLSDPTLNITEINERHAVVKLGGRTLVADEQRGNLDFLSFADFERLYNNVQVALQRPTALGRYWINHPDRRQYLDGIVFDPSRNISQAQYNLWKGFAIEPDSLNGCNLFHEHLKIVICSGEQAQYEYILNWLALLVQKPGLLPQVALVLLSDQGTGKGLLMEYLGKIFGRHYKHIMEKSHLVGNFSGHLQDAVLVFADELSWDGNKADAGILKGLITEPTRMMEKKFADAVPVKNCMHLVIASNESWAIPAEASDRRYCVLEVSSCKVGDLPYFDALASEMNGGGPSGLLAFLLQRDISSFRASDFPKTAARVNQQLQSLEPVETWLLEQLQLGFLSTVKSNSEWPEKVKKDDVYKHFTAWYRNQKLKESLPTLAIFTKKLCCFGITPCRMPPQKNGKRPYGYKFETLDMVRENFEATLGGKIDWGDSDDY